MYYHIDIWDVAHVIVARHINLEWDLVRDRVLPAYRRGALLTLDGRTVATRTIRRIRILETPSEVNPGTPHDDKCLRALGYTYSTEEQDITNQWITGPPGEEAALEREADMTTRHPSDIHPDLDAREVFVIHGRNAPARDAMFAFLRALELHPLEWQELVASTEQGSPYIGDILDVAFSRARAVVVLMTPDDEARLREQFRNDDESGESDLKGQARPNVIFEAGRALGLHAPRTILVEIGDLRPFSDIAGRHTIRLDGSPERRHHLAERLKSAGCPANTGGSDWLSAGDFETAIELAGAVNTNPAGGPLTTSGVPPESVVDAISTDAADMLLATSGSPSGRLLKVSLMGGTIMQAGAESFGELGNPRSEARWKSALDELLTRGLMRYDTGDAYEVTHDGFVFADTLKAK